MDYSKIVRERRLELTMDTKNSLTMEQISPILGEMYRSRETLLPDGTKKRFGCEISPAHANALYHAVQERAPRSILEIGMAQGASTLTILSASSKSDGELISIDPYVNWSSGRLAALNAVSRAGYSERHQHVQLYSFEALARFLVENRRFDFVYIDGSHDYDDVFIDWFFSDKLLTPGGVIGFNDTGHSGVFPVVSRVAKRRDYRELDVGLEADYKGRNALVTAARYLLRRPRQDRYFQKIG